MSVVTGVLLALLVVSILSIAYAYFLYPAALWVGVQLLSSPTHAVRPDEHAVGHDEHAVGHAEETRPTVTLIIAAYNEEGVIAEKIENSLQLEYPDEKLEIVVFSDASSDRTDDIVRSYADRGVELERIEGRVGKTACQNQVAEMADTDLLVFSDANCMYESDAIKRLVARFDNDVGCVVGELRHTRTENDVEGESLYWRYTRLVKRLETKLGSVVKGNGAIYAVRRADYVPLPADAMSDFAEPLAIRKRGRMVKYASDAVAREQTAGTVEAERDRKTRIATRSWHTVSQHLELFNPSKYGWYSLKLFTDTILWWSTPFLFVLAFLSATALFVSTMNPVFGVVLLGHVLLVLFGALGYYLDRRRASVPFLFHVPYYFLVGNYSLLVGTWNFLRGHNIVTWETMNE